MKSKGTKGTKGTKGVLAIALLGLACRHQPSAEPTPAMIEVLPVEQTSGTTALLQAVSAAGETVVWAAGHKATWVRTTDGGATWQAGAMSGRDSTLEFRDVHAVSATTAYLLSAGPGGRSRIYKTTNAGASWQLQFLNRDTSAFYDCFDFWDENNGIAVSDISGGRMPVIVTSDGGEHWNPVPAGAMPPALPGEGAFAASGSCLVTAGRAEAWIASTGARIFHTRDRGRTWSVVSTPAATGTATGLAALAFVDARRGFALGGQLADSLGRSDSVVVVTHDGGATWSLAARPTFSGGVYGAASPGGTVVVAVGPRGLDYSLDGAATWRGLSAQAYWSVGFASRSVGWAVGPRGRITRLIMVYH